WHLRLFSGDGTNGLAATVSHVPGGVAYGKWRLPQRTDRAGNGPPVPEIPGNPAPGPAGLSARAQRLSADALQDRSRAALPELLYQRGQRLELERTGDRPGLLYVAALHTARVGRVCNHSLRSQCA